MRRQHRPFTGPPDWLSPEWGASQPGPKVDAPTGSTDPPKRNVISVHRELIDSCPYRGPIVSEGCNCTRLCLAGKGYNPENEEFGKVNDSDCWKCVDGNQ